MYRINAHLTYLEDAHALDECECECDCDERSETAQALLGTTRHTEEHLIYARARVHVLTVVQYPVRCCTDLRNLMTAHCSLLTAHCSLAPDPLYFVRQSSHSSMMPSIELNMQKENEAQES